MDEDSKILLSAVMIAVIISAGFAFYDTIILQHFEVIDSSQNY